MANNKPPRRNNRRRLRRRKRNPFDDQSDICKNFKKIKSAIEAADAQAIADNEEFIQRYGVNVES